MVDRKSKNSKKGKMASRPQKSASSKKVKVSKKTVPRRYKNVKSAKASAFKKIKSPIKKHPASKRAPPLKKTKTIIERHPSPKDAHAIKGEPSNKAEPPKKEETGYQSSDTIICPVCKTPGLRIIMTPMDIPYFEKVLETTIKCESCGFKHNDMICTKYGEPTRAELEIASVEDMSVRVIKSSSATINLPELGLLREPGPLSDASVTNVEGIIESFKSAVEYAISFADEEDKKEAGRKILAVLEDIREGKKKTILVIDDPFGNSAILCDRTKKRTLTPKELDELKTGMIVIDVDKSGQAPKK